MNWLRNLILGAFFFQLQVATHAQDTNVPSAIVNANNAFAMSLYTWLAKQPGNFVFSPFSIDTALTMAYAGARGVTAAQMASVLHYTDTNTDIPSNYSDFLSQENGLNTPGIQFHTARSLWAQSGYPLLKPFQDFLQNKYQADLRQTDLTGWPSGFDPKIAAAARAQINGWAVTNSCGKILNAISEDLIDPNTRMLLLNTAYFKGQWQIRFDPEQATNGIFWVGPYRSISVPMMHVHGHFRYCVFGNFEAVQLPYISNRLSMLIILTDSFDDFSKWQTNFDKFTTKLFDNDYAYEPNLKRPPLWIEQLCQMMGTGDLEVSMPKFSISSAFDLNDPLQELGMHDAFGSEANFSGITPMRPFYDRTFDSPGAIDCG